MGYRFAARKDASADRLVAEAMPYFLVCDIRNPFDKLLCRRIDGKLFMVEFKTQENTEPIKIGPRKGQPRRTWRLKPSQEKLITQGFPLRVIENEDQIRALAAEGLSEDQREQLARAERRSAQRVAREHRRRP